MVGFQAMAYTLEDLFPPDVGETLVEILDADGDVLELVLIGALDLVGFADSEVKGQANPAVRV